MEQRINIKFCYKLGKNAMETHEMLKSVYGNNALSRTTVYEWFSRFSGGREDIMDNEITGRPSTSRNDDNVKKIKEIVEMDTRISLRMIEEEIGINKETIRKILSEDLDKRKICSRFVPHSLTPEQKKTRVDYCKDFISTSDNDSNFFKSIVTGDETWCFQYDPETKRQSMQWCSKGSPKPKKVRLQKSKIKTMLITFFDSKGIIHKEFMPSGSTVNAIYYKGVMDRLLKRIARVRPEYKSKGSWSLLHDNAPGHKATIVKQFLHKKGVVLIEHPPYSPDLTPADFMLFPKLKSMIKGTKFDDIKDIQTNVTYELKNIPKKEFQISFENLYRRCDKCIQVMGDYFEG